MGVLPPGQVQVYFGTFPPNDVLDSAAQEEENSHEIREQWLAHLSTVSPRPSSKGLPLSHLERQSAGPRLSSLRDEATDADDRERRTARALAELGYRYEYERTFKPKAAATEGGPADRRLGLQSVLRSAAGPAVDSGSPSRMERTELRHHLLDELPGEMEEHPVERDQARALAVGVLRKRVEQQRTAGRTAPQEYAQDDPQG